MTLEDGKIRTNLCWNELHNYCDAAGCECECHDTPETTGGTTNG